MGPIARLKRWQEDRKERRVAALTATASDIKEDKQYDLLFLHQRGVVRAKGTGQSITLVHADVENLIRKKIVVVITPGTYFVSSGGHQNMVTTEEYTFTLSPCSSQQLRISAACINAKRPIPGKGDRFDGVARVPENVARFLEASKNENSMVIQAGVWTLTDDYSRYDVINHLISRDTNGNTSHPVTHDHCDKAKAILERLGIPHRLWYSEKEYEKKTEDYNNGSYSGEFRHGERHGLGKYIWKDGDSYEGEFKEGKRTGRGKFTSKKSGDSYEGEFKDGVWHGRGKYTWGSGESHEGEWKDGQFRHGEGVFIYDDGGKYVGKVEDGKQAGGRHYYPNGSQSNPSNRAKSADAGNAQRRPEPQTERNDSKERGRDDSAASGETAQDWWRFCVKCKTSDLPASTSIQLKRKQAGLCPYCEGRLIDRETYWRSYRK